MAREVITINRGGTRLIKRSKRVNKGSKRHLRQIRWTATEIASLVVFAILTLGVVIVVLLWELPHGHPRSEPPTHPQIRDAEPPSESSEGRLASPSSVLAFEFRAGLARPAGLTFLASTQRAGKAIG